MVNEKQKKVAIATFHSAHNYGAVLQTYALYKVLEKLGNDVYLLDYSPRNIRKSYTLFPNLKDCDGLVHFIKSWVSLFLDFKRRYKRYVGFDSFLKENFKTLKGDRVVVDSIIVGSDQIWNPTITDGFDENYFGISSIVQSKNIFSYAASMGISSLTEKDESVFISLLDNLSSIGVREKELQVYISGLIRKSVNVNLDPTLLLEKKDWASITGKSSKSGRYLLIYEVKEHSQTFNVANSIAKNLGLEIVVLTAKTSYKISKEYETDKSPEDFLSLFRDADFIVTTSFHGTAFSIINEKDFYTLEFGNDVDLRSKNLLSEVGLLHRMVPELLNLSIDNLHIDYPNTLVENKLNSLRENSISYIENSLKG
ncbi:polysaccharide pyruvyl transferase family protein [Pectobacterium carotovorum subsp. carotovorum]|uniref:polysaccharide pyruvyl transferase family protein n=1 Tax=Pectobacterium carotovorum TaxID=554 RepID=UPI0016037B18|nr:polysaccharide pyruvyl transferase family protein [Pectobacterium carotovorum]MBB1527439.1 polysaccharide pyruvyl transferase family protein [Pectobacterium carotovorum subsp. carotovorum]MCA6965377.1 polysaccharide pyruvyl transferase family protein [Pectobacterium carotovorum]MCH4987801.1 polysaccharide pyruvyl transferase family protein [Pectobacterium carotovorum]